MILPTLGDRLCLEGSAYWNDILYNEGKIVICHIKKTKKRYFPNQRRNEPVQIFFWIMNMILKTFIGTKFVWQN